MSLIITGLEEDAMTMKAANLQTAKIGQNNEGETLRAACLLARPRESPLRALTAEPTQASAKRHGRGTTRSFQTVAEECQAQPNALTAGIGKTTIFAESLHDRSPLD